MIPAPDWLACGSCLTFFDSAKNRTHSGDQLQNAEGLGQVVVGAGFQAQYPIKFG